MADTMPCTLTTTHMAAFLAWRAQVEAETGHPIAGVLCFLFSSPDTDTCTCW